MCTDERCRHPWTCHCRECDPRVAEGYRPDAWLTLNGVELREDLKPDEEGKIVLFASDLGLPPGIWPVGVTVQDADGDSRSFYLHRKVRKLEEVIALVYVDRKAAELHIVND